MNPFKSPEAVDESCSLKKAVLKGELHSNYIIFLCFAIIGLE